MRKNNVIWWIWVPMVLAILVFFGGTYLFIESIITDTMLVNQWANISAIYLLAPILIFLLLSTITAIFFMIAIHRIHTGGRSFIRRSQLLISNFKSKTLQFCSVCRTVSSGPKTWLKSLRRFSDNE